MQTHYHKTQARKKILGCVADSETITNFIIISDMEVIQKLLLQGRYVVYVSLTLKGMPSNYAFSDLPFFTFQAVKIILPA